MKKKTETKAIGVSTDWLLYYLLPRFTPLDASDSEMCAWLRAKSSRYLMTPS